MSTSRNVVLTALTAILIGTSPAWSAPFGAPHPAAGMTAPGIIGWMPDNQVRVWDAVTGTTLHILQDYWAPVSAVVFSPDGKSLAYSCEVIPPWSGVFTSEDGCGPLPDG